MLKFYFPDNNIKKIFFTSALILTHLLRCDPSEIGYSDALHPH